MNEWIASLVDEVLAAAILGCLRSPKVSLVKS